MEILQECFGGGGLFVWLVGCIFNLCLFGKFVTWFIFFFSAEFKVFCMRS